jgi:pyruvate kinase
MAATKRAAARDTWDTGVCDALIKELWALRRAMQDKAAVHAQALSGIDPAQAASAANLLHYLALRRFDLRPVQEQLAWLGLSSLGRSETHVLANLDKVLGILHRLAGRPWTPLADEEPVGSRRGPALLQQHADALLGRAPPGRSVRIMVTLPSEAAAEDQLIDALVRHGMDIARINCAHDTPDQWSAMAVSVRKAARRHGRRVRVLMDLAGPKVRTGPVAFAQGVVRLRPRRDALGRVIEPARLSLRPAGTRAVADGAAAALGVDAAWFAALAPGDRIDLKDARDARRRLVVAERHSDCVVVTATQTAYLTAETVLRRRGSRGSAAKTQVHDLPVAQGFVHLKRGELLHLCADGIGHDAVASSPGQRAKPACIACTLPQALTHLRKGDRVWFDDGRIGGVVRRRVRGKVEVEIVQAREGGERLAADKGINLPDTALGLPALTEKDLEDLEVVARHADIVGLSFCQCAEDVHALWHRLAELDAQHLGVMLKIETRRAFEHLPEMLLAAMHGPRAGVMIARGDLAVECGYERMAEVQEEILWACEAAHMPVVWATQVLETLAKTGLPSRAEITDAAMGERAECVMLNKGPHILDAMRTLDDILRRMQAHQSKKRPLLRALKAWDQIGGAPPGPTVAGSGAGLPKGRPGP